MDYETLLKNAPPQDSPEFIGYLREHNVVVEENKDWIVIENAKYHTPEAPWLTAFLKYPFRPLGLAFGILGIRYMDWEWRKKATNKQTVPGRFHVHLIAPLKDKESEIE